MNAVTSSDFPFGLRMACVHNALTNRARGHVTADRSLDLGDMVAEIVMRLRD
jgi:hypothetical protein